MRRTPPHALSRRERQIMDIVYAQGEVSAALLGNPLGEGHPQQPPEKGPQYYTPTRRRAQVGRSALRRVLDTFFEGSLEKAVAALLQGADANLSQQDLKRLG